MENKFIQSDNVCLLALCVMHLSINGEILITLTEHLVYVDAAFSALCE